MAYIRELDHCIFCGGTHVTEEHVIAAWVLRAFLRRRRSEAGLSGTLVGDGQLRITADDPISTAKVVCRACNNGWMSRIDNAAAQVLKPLIRGDDSVALDPAGQAAFAAWLYKTAIIFDASANGNDGGLVPLRQGLKATQEAGPGCIIYAGPAGPPPRFSVPGVPEVAGLRMFGIREVNGTMCVTVNIKNPDGTVTPGASQDLTIPGYQVLLGGLHAYLGGQVPPVTPESLQGFVQVWPAKHEPVTVSPTLRGTPPGP